jgi:hypothetical protein
MALMYMPGTQRPAAMGTQTVTRGLSGRQRQRAPARAHDARREDHPDLRSTSRSNARMTPHQRDDRAQEPRRAAAPRRWSLCERRRDRLGSGTVRGGMGSPALRKDKEDGSPTEQNDDRCVVRDGLVQERNAADGQQCHDRRAKSRRARWQRRVSGGRPGQRRTRDGTEEPEHRRPASAEIEQVVADHVANDSAARDAEDEGHEHPAEVLSSRSSHHCLLVWIGPGR